MGSIWGTVGSVAGGIIGSIIAPGVGTAAGASLGGALGGLADGKDAPPKFDDPNAWQRDYASRQLMDSNIGAKGAAGAAGQEMNFARDQAEEVSNNPSLAGNAAAQAGVRNKLLMGAQRGAQSAYLHGAEIDSENKAKGAQIAGESSRIAQSNFAMNQGYADRPSWSEQLLHAGASTAIGLAASALGSKSDPSGGGGGNGDNTNTGSNTTIGSITKTPTDFNLGTIAPVPSLSSGSGYSIPQQAPTSSSFGVTPSMNDASWRNTFDLTNIDSGKTSITEGSPLTGGSSWMDYK